MSSSWTCPSCASYSFPHLHRKNHTFHFVTCSLAYYYYYYLSLQIHRPSDLHSKTLLVLEAYWTCHLDSPVPVPVPDHSAPNFSCSYFYDPSFHHLAFSFLHLSQSQTQTQPYCYLLFVQDDHSHKEETSATSKNYLASELAVHLPVDNSWENQLLHMYNLDTCIAFEEIPAEEPEPVGCDSDTHILSVGNFLVLAYCGNRRHKDNQVQHLLALEFPGDVLTYYYVVQAGHC
mmetsp:Transcript_234/g.289  ORF Transcript_234/g.289 Transcript_234/m.289 type:complete len:232 (+) Transcript_234:926-1621(+)